MTEEKTLPTPSEGGEIGETPQEEIDELFGEEAEAEAEEKVDIKSLQEAIGRNDIKTQEDVIKWAKNITKYVGENEFSKKAKEYEEFRKATGKTPKEFLETLQTSAPHGDEVREKVESLEATIHEPNIKFVMEEAKTMAKATGKTPLEVFRENKKLQRLAADLAKEEKLKSSITPPSERLRIKGKSFDELSDEERKASFHEIKAKILKKHGLA